MHFQNLRAWMESERFGFQAEIFSDAFVFELDRALAGVADQERHRMFDARMMAGDKGIDGRKLVDESVFEQEVQRAVHRWRRIGAYFGFHLLKQVIGLDRLPVRGNQSQNLLTDRGQAQAALRADLLDRGDKRLRVMHMMVRMGAVVGMAAHQGSFDRADCRRAKASARPHR